MCSHSPKIPDSGTINGKGRYIGGPATPWARLNVVRGQRYRFRIINASAYGYFTFSIGMPLLL
jgi:iron transport multicopper oxidase